MGPKAPAEGGTATVASRRLEGARAQEGRATAVTAAGAQGGTAEEDGGGGGAA